MIFHFSAYRSKVWLPGGQHNAASTQIEMESANCFFQGLDLQV
jgi:hypothetical protein